MKDLELTFDLTAAVEPVSSITAAVIFSLIQEYQHPMGKIFVINDHQVDALYVQSDFDLKRYFK